MHRSGRVRGYTVLEMAVVLAVIGTLAATGAAAYARLNSLAQNNLSVAASTAMLSESVVAFAARNHRLPCPSTDGSGLEGGNGVCDTAATGLFPYLSVGLPLPSPGARAWYGVYRDAAVDLARAQEHTGDAAGSLSFADRGDFIRALRLSALQAATTARPFVTGDGAAGGAENCAGNVGANPAFVLVIPGDDSDGDGSAFDGIHQALAGGSRCFSAPTRAHDSGFDDTTHAISFYALMARLNQ